MEKITANMTAFLINEIGELRSDEYADKNGLPICKKCHTARYFRSDDGSFLTRCLCECQAKAFQAQEEREKNERRILELKKYAITNTRYANATFDTTEIINNESFIKCFNRCKSYCQNADKVVNTSYGLYICGNVGCGKTHIVYCMANALTNKLYSCLVTNFINIINTIKENFDDKMGLKKFMHSLSSVDFLFIDDLGVERVLAQDGNTNWVQERMFEVIDERYNANKPIIFTSNYKISELIKAGFHERLASRITEMSSVAFNIDAGSYRLKLRKEKELPF